MNKLLFFFLVTLSSWSYAGSMAYQPISLDLVCRFDGYELRSMTIGTDKKRGMYFYFNDNSDNKLYRPNNEPALVLTQVPPGYPPPPFINIGENGITAFIKGKDLMDAVKSSEPVPLKLSIDIQGGFGMLLGQCEGKGAKL